MNEMLAAVELSDRLYFRFAAIVHRNAGISLGDAKRELVRSRLLKRLRELGLPTFEAYHDHLLHHDPHGEELTHMLDIIFCRNVMIYFDRATQEALVNRFHRYLNPGGYLFVGHSEHLNAMKTPFRFVQPTIYIRP